MAFQFMCPRGHLLEADPAAAGQQCTCPHCGMVFLIPAPPAPAVVAAPAHPGGVFASGAGYAAGPAPIGPPQQPASFPAPQMHAAPGAFGPPQSAPAPFMPAPPAGPGLPQVGPAFPATAAATTPGGPAPGAPMPAPDVTKPAAPEILHIPCPNGHELDTPREMLNQEVLCPHCGEQFLLREKDSVEYKRKKQQEAEIRERKSGQAWLNWAIVVAVLVVIGLVVLIFATSG